MEKVVEWEASGSLSGAHGSREHLNLFYISSMTGYYVTTWDRGVWR